MPVVTSQPRLWNPNGPPSGHSLDQINAGETDWYYNEYFKRVAAHGRPFYFRLMQEIDKPFFPWGQGVGSNTPAKFVRAWKRIHGIAQAQGATNAKFVWCPDWTITSTQAASLYPGSSYVDWIAIDGYNWGNAESWSSWKSLGQVFGPAHDVLSPYGKPMFIAETASVESGGSKAQWIEQAYLNDVHTRLPKVKAIVWFNYSGYYAEGRDWRINSSESSLAAYKKVMQDPKTQGTLP